MQTNSQASAAVISEEANYRDIRITPARDLQSEARGELRVDANEVAKLLKISDLVERIRAVKRESPNAPKSKTFNNMRMICMWRIFTASEEVRKAVALIDFDLAAANCDMDSLNAKRMATTNMVNTLNFMQSGILGIVKNSMALEHQAPRTRQYIAMTSFGTGAGVAGLNFIMPSLWSKKGSEIPNMLGHIFNPNFRPVDAQQSYLWQFFSAEIPGSTDKLTRRQVLLKHWQEIAGVHEKQRAMDKLAGTMADPERESISFLRQRIQLLQDMKTHIEEFDGSLYELHKAISTEGAEG